MARQNKRFLSLFISLLLFPVTLYYFSPALILGAALDGIINGSCIVFALQFVCSLFTGRLFCSWICPAGGLQEALMPSRPKTPKQGWRNNIKHGLWFIWLAIVAFCYFKSWPIKGIDFFLETQNGISATSVQSYAIYYFIIAIVAITAIAGGDRAFCHYLCWMAPFMITGIKLGKLAGLPAIAVSCELEKCTSCGSCAQKCPMGIEPKYARENSECIHCAECVDICTQKALSIKYSIGNKDGYREEA
jgi:polyferredoxin